MEIKIWENHPVVFEALSLPLSLSGSFSHAIAILHVRTNCACMQTNEHVIYLRLVSERVYGDIGFYGSRNDIAKSSQCPVNCSDSIPHADPVRRILSLKYI